MESTVAPPDDSWLLRFGGVARLVGAAALAKLAAARVAVIGIGGVGSWAAEGLVRSGVGAVTLIDLDDVCITNTNRQLPALADTVGRPKVDVMAERLRLINPACRITPVAEFLTASNAGLLLRPDHHDWVIDAVDRTSIKTLIIAHCRSAGIQVLTIGGAGGRRDGSAFRVTDLSIAGGDELLRGVKRALRREHGFPKGENQPMGVPCVFSPEPRVYPRADGTCSTTPDGSGDSLRMDCASGFGAAVFVTGVAGLLAAGEVVRRIAEASRPSVQ